MLWYSAQYRDWDLSNGTAPREVRPEHGHWSFHLCLFCALPLCWAGQLPAAATGLAQPELTLARGVSTNQARHAPCLSRSNCIACLSMVNSPDNS